MSEMSEMWGRFFRGSKYEAKWLAACSAPRALIGAAPRQPRRPQESRPHRWYGEGLAALEEAYAGPLKLAAIAHDFGTSIGEITRQAQKHGWPPRRAPYAKKQAGQAAALRGAEGVATTDSQIPAGR